VERNHFIKRRKPPKKRRDKEYGDGRVFKADKSKLREEVFERSGGRCEAELTSHALSSPGHYSVINSRCPNEITLKSMHLAHEKHGHGFRSDTPETCKAKCEDCHRNGDHGSKCTYPRRAGKIMNFAQAREYWRGKLCFCGTTNQPKPKPQEASFCDDCLRKIPPALRYDLEHAEGKDYLKVLAECETAIMQFNIRGEHAE